jgi:hypothetical protein
LYYDAAGPEYPENGFMFLGVDLVDSLVIEMNAIEAGFKA